MTDNLARLDGLLLSEAAMLRLALVMGRDTAHEILYGASMAAFKGKRRFRDVLLSDPRITSAITAQELDGVLRPGE